MRAALALCAVAAAAAAIEVLTPTKPATAAAEVLNYSAIFSKAPVSTIMDAGASQNHLAYALDQLCRMRGLHDTLREFRGFRHHNWPSRASPSRKLTCREQAGWDGGKLLGCGCPYSGRNAQCYGFATHRGVL